MSAGCRVVGVDVGGTRLSVGLVSEAGDLTALRREPTPRDAGAEGTLPRLEALVEQTLAEAGAREVAAIGIGFGGPVDHATGAIRLSHHASGWEGVKLADILAERFGLPATLENDANAAGLGEALFGAGRGLADILYVNIGTGVGGAVIIAGRVHHGAHSNAGELGHVVVDPAGPPCTCGKRGCVEALCSGDAIGRMAQERLGRADITGRRVGELAMQGDAVAREIVGRAAAWMGLALAAAVNLLDPAAVILGGGVPEMGETYLAPVREAFLAHVMDLPAQRTPLLPAQLGYDAGVIGAAAVALHEPLRT